MTGWIDTGARLLVGFFINPITVSFLGPFFYGIWQIIGQMNSYMVTADLRTSTALKWIIAKERTIKTGEELRLSVSSALLTNIIFLPLYLIIGGIIIYLAPYVTKVEQQHFYLVRITSTLLVFSFITTQFFFLFESVLYGMNLSYKRLGIRAFLTFFSGFLTVTALYLGYGMPGMAVIKLFTALITGLTFFFIVKKFVDWFGFAKVKIQQVVGFFKTTGWFMAMKIADLLNQSVDLILLGYFAGPTYVTSYTLSRFLIISGTNLIRGGVNSVTPGLARFIGEKNFEKILFSRKQLITISWLVLGSMGVVVNLWNDSFLQVWTKGDYFAGQLETFLLVFFIVQKTLQQHDASIITMALELKKKIALTFASALITIILSVFLIPSFKTAGLLVSLNLGALILNISFSKISGEITESKNLFFDLCFSRVAITGFLLLILSGYIGSFLFVETWPVVIFFMGLTAAGALAMLWLIGLKMKEKKILIENFNKIKLFKKDS